MFQYFQQKLNWIVALRRARTGNACASKGGRWWEGTRCGVGGGAVDGGACRGRWWVERLCAGGCSSWLVCLLVGCWMGSVGSGEVLDYHGDRDGRFFSEVGVEGYEFLYVLATLVLEVFSSSSPLPGIV